MPITPSPNRSRQPAFHELDADTFEEMSSALYEKEPGIKLADLYRTKHKPQHGIDVRAERKDGGIEVASCKCVGQIKKGDIDQWSTDFLQHWESHWKETGVRQFVLVVAVPVNSRERDDEIKKQRERFEAIDVTYNVWAPRQLQEKLRPHPGIVSQYMGAEWVPRLCGAVAEFLTTATPDTGASVQFMASQLEALQSALSAEIEKLLDVAVEAIRCGDLVRVNDELAALRARPSWTELSASTRARVIRLQGSLRLHHGDLAGAQLLSDEADAIAVPEEFRFRALLAARRVSAAEGLRVLGEPASRDGVQLKIALLLEAGGVDEAIGLLDTHPQLKEPMAETERLRAWTELFRGRRADALAAVQRAELMSPRWPAIRRAGGIVRYALALSPLATADWYLGPNPVDLDLVREDDQARTLLHEAFSRFDALVAEDVDPEMRLLDEAWALACLSNLRERLGEAEARSRAILSRTPTHSLVVMWALARGFEFDRPVSIHALSNLVDQTQADSQQVLVLAWLLAAEERFQEGERVLQETASLFETPRAEASRDQWLAEFSARDATTVAATPPPQGSASYQLWRLVERAQETDDWAPVERCFHDLMSVATPPPHALPAARALAGAQRWNVIAPYTDALLRFSTAEAVRLAVHSAYRTGQPKRALQILEAHRSAFPARVLPNDLRAIEIEALHSTGDPAEALRRASMLAAESLALGHQMVKANIHLRTGNIRAALPTIRQAIIANFLSPHDALQLAQRVAMEDSELARGLWRYAKAKGIPDHLAVVALMQSFRLGIEHEAAQLFGVMANLAEQGTGIVRFASMNDVVEHVRRAREGAANLQQIYFNGVAPVHLVVGRLNINLAKLFSLVDPQEKPLATGPIMIRHAGRPRVCNIATPITDWRIQLDITGLLLASQLELLDYLERLPHPIAFSPSIPSALQQLELDARPSQPRHVTAMREVLANIETGVIAVVEIPGEQDAMSASRDDSARALSIAAASRDDAVIVDHRLPQGVEGVAHRFTTLHAVAEGLHRAGALDTTTFNEALAKMGTYARESGGTPPRPGATVLFIDNTFSVLATADLMKPVTRTYRVQIDSVLSSMARDEVAQAERDETIATRLAVLRNRVAEGLENGRYTLFAASRNDAHHIDVNEAGPTAAGVVQCLLDLIGAHSAPGAVFWVDDRHVTGYQQNSRGSQLICVTDVLQALRHAKIITDGYYFEALLRLRASGAMFIPVEPEEVYYHLKTAPVVNNAVVETPALATLRRYIARTLLLDSHLKVGDSPQGLGGRPDETVFLLAIRRLAEECVIGQWKDDNLTDEVRRAYSDWIWDALRIDKFLREDLASNKGDRALLLPALQVCGLFTAAIDVVGSRPRTMLPRLKALFAWVDHRVLGSRLDDDPALAERVTQLLVSMLLGHLDWAASRETREHRFVKRLLRFLFEQYPAAIRRRLLVDSNLCQRLEVEVTATVTLGKRTFNAQRLWKAVREALAYGKSHVRTTQGGRGIIVRRVPGQEYAVRFGGDRVVVKDPAFALLDRSPARRRAAIQQHSDWFDMPEREQVIRNVSEIDDPVTRIHRLGELRKRSAAWHYTKLNDRLRTRTGHAFREFWPPGAGAVLDHLRLPSDKTISFSDRLVLAANALIADYGPGTALGRLAGIPVAIPEPVLQAFRAMPAAQRKSAVASVCNSAKTPLQLLHALALFRAVAEGKDRGLFEASVDRLLNDWREITKLFTAVLKWTNAAYTHDPEWVDLPATDRLVLVWTHADRLTGLMLGVGFESDRVARDFEANHRPVPLREVLRRDPAYHGAAANPDTIGPDCLLFHGLSYVLNGVPAIDVLSSTHLDTIHNLLTMEVNGRRVTSFWLLVNREAANNDLGSFFTRRPEGLSLLDASLTAVSQAIDQLLCDLEADPMSQKAWPIVWALSNPAMDSRDQARLLAVIERIDLASLVKREPDDIFICRMVVDCWSRLAGRDTCPNIVTQLEQLAAYLASRYAGTVSTKISEVEGSETQRDLVQLIETTGLSARGTDPAKAFTQLGDTIMRLAAAWPRAAPVFRVMLSNAMVREPVLFCKGLWRSWLVMRTY